MTQKNNSKQAPLIALVACAILFAACVFAQAQQPTRIPRIGYLDAVPFSSNPARSEAFRLGLRELGYVEGKNIAIEWRSSDGKADRLPGLAAELVGLKLDVIISGGSTTTRAAKEATTTIPIVMSQDNDPVENGFVASLARPGGNITGLATLRSELSGKRLELLKEIVPQVSRVVVVGSSTNPGNNQSLKETEIAAAAFGVALHYADVLGATDIDAAFQEAKKARADAVLILASPVLNSRRTQVVEVALKSRLPAIYDRRDLAKSEVC